MPFWYRMYMATTPLMPVRIDPEIVAQLDVLAAERGTTRSGLVREAIALILDEADSQNAHQKDKG